MKTSVLLLSIFCFGNIFSQVEAYPKEEKLFQVSANWSVGDKRKVHTDISTKVIYDGVLVSNQRNIYDVNFKVLSSDDYFLLSYTSYDRLPSVLGNSEDTNESVVNQKIRSLLREAEDEIAKKELHIQVNKQTGAALEIKNGLEIAKKVEFEKRKELRTWAENEKKSEKEIRTLEIDLAKRFEEMFPKIKQTILDKTSTIFSSYNVAFPMNKSIEKEVKTRDITASNSADTLFPAIMKIESAEIKNRMTVKTSLDYDKDYLLQQLKKSYSKLENVKASEVSISEKEEIIFDTKTTWIYHHITNLNFEIPGMKTITKTTVTFM